MMNFTDMSAAIKYVREMDEEATVAIGDHEVWKFDNGEILVVEPGSEVSDEDDATLVGTVAKVLY